MEAIKYANNPMIAAGMNGCSISTGFEASF